MSLKNLLAVCLLCLMPTNVAYPQYFSGCYWGRSSVRTVSYYPAWTTRCFRAIRHPIWRHACYPRHHLCGHCCRWHHGCGHFCHYHHHWKHRCLKPVGQNYLLVLSRKRGHFFYDAASSTLMSRVWWNGIYYQDQLEAQTTIEDPYFVHYTTRSPHKWAIERQTSIFPGYRVFHKAKPDANWVCIAWGRYNPCGTGIGSGQQPVASKTIPPAYGDRAGTPAQSVSVTFDAPERSKLDRQDEQLTLSTSNDTYTNIVLTQADSSQPNSDDRPSFYRRATSTDHATNDAKDTKTISITWRYNAQRERSLYKTSPRTPQIVRVTPQSRPWAEPIDFMVSDADHSIGEERFGNFGSKPISDERGDMAELAQTE